MSKRTTTKTSRSMTNEQILVALATEVMGWETGAIYWELDGKPTDYLVCVIGVIAGDKVRAAPGVFDPLGDHNHMALVRKKMRDNGWTRDSRDSPYFELTHVFYTKRNLVAENTIEAGSTHKDELMAEALVILRAVRKGGGEC